VTRSCGVFVTAFFIDAPPGRNAATQFEELDQVARDTAPEIIADMASRRGSR
jgi:hypothetical protein